jgi:hypothetical protein
VSEIHESDDPAWTARFLRVLADAIAAGMPVPYTITPSRDTLPAELHFSRGSKAEVDAWADHLDGHPVAAIQHDGAILDPGDGSGAFRTYRAVGELDGHPVEVWAPLPVRSEPTACEHGAELVEETPSTFPDGEPIRKFADGCLTIGPYPHRQHPNCTLDGGADVEPEPARPYPTFNLGPLTADELELMGVEFGDQHQPAGHDLAA